MYQQSNTKMDILINEKSTLSINGITFNNYSLNCEGKESLIVVASGKLNYINVIILNAAHKAWKGNGKFFSTIDAAMANYKDVKIKAMIQATQIN